MRSLPEGERSKEGAQERVVSAGFGGQGIMLLGKLLSMAAMAEKKYVTWMPSYGAEVRGGTAHSMVIVSEQPIPSPVVTAPTTCIVMNKPSLRKFEGKVARGGLLVVNASLVGDGIHRKDITVLKLPATEIAAELGNQKAANMIMLGAYLRRKKTVALKTVIESLQSMFASKKSTILKINEQALKKGWELAHG